MTQIWDFWVQIFNEKVVRSGKKWKLKMHFREKHQSNEIEKENIVNPLQKKIDRMMGLGAQIPHLGITV